jgi:hypothetical protein
MAMNLKNISKNSSFDRHFCRLNINIKAEKPVCAYSQTIYVKI